MENYMNNLVLSDNYFVLEKGTPHNIIHGKYKGQYRNMYWKVRANTIEAVSSNHIFDIFYIMDVLTFFL